MLAVVVAVVVFTLDSSLSFLELTVMMFGLVVVALVPSAGLEDVLRPAVMLVMLVLFTLKLMSLPFVGLTVVVLILPEAAGESVMALVAAVVFRAVVVAVKLMSLMLPLIG